MKQKHLNEPCFVDGLWLKIKLMKSNLLEALSDGRNAIIMTTTSDVKDLAREVARVVIAELKPFINEGANQISNKDYLTANEVCEIVGVSKPTLWRWANNGYLTPIMVGAGKCKVRKFRTIDIKRILQQRS